MDRRATTTIVEPLGATRPDNEPLRQPNERDEASTAAGRIDELADVQRDQMRRAQADRESGRTDTDCRGVPASADRSCARPQAPDLLDSVLAPGDPRASEAENLRSARHDPGAPAPGPDGRPAADQPRNPAIDAGSTQRS